MRKKFFAVFLFCILIFEVVPLMANAETIPYFTYSLDAQSAAPDKLVKLKINANQTYDTAAGFRMIIDYDDTVLSFVRTENSSQIKSGTMMTNGKINPIYSVYVCDVDQKTAPVLSGNIISFVFKVKDDAMPGKTAIGAHIDEICNYQAQLLNLNYDEDLTLQIEPEEDPLSKAYLTSLEPLDGTLTPQFSSDVFEYGMNVGSEVKSVVFAAAAGDKGTVKINRKTLGKAGSDTAIIATVTSADKKAKAQYVITVHRAEVLDTADVTSKSRGDSQQPAVKTGTTANDWYEPSPGKTGGTDATDQPENPVAGTTPNQSDSQSPQGNFGYGTRNIYIMGNQMPSYLSLLSVCGQFILVGIGLIFLFKLKK